MATKRLGRFGALSTLALGATLLTGCVSLESAFKPVDEMVAERTGEQVEWLGITAQPDEVSRHIADLLEEPLTEGDAIEIALLNNRDLQARFAELGISRAELLEATLPANPRLSATWRRIPSGPSLWEGEAVFRIVDMLMIPMRRNVAQAELEQTQLDVTAAVIDLIGETRRAWYEAVAAEQFLELWQSVLLAAESSYEMSFRLREAGNISEWALVSERALYEETKLNVSEAETAVVAARERLTRLMGLWGHATDWRTPRRLPEIPNEKIGLDNIERRAVERSLDLAMLWQAIEVAAGRRGIASVTSWLPELELGIWGEQEKEMGETNWITGPVFSFPVPIFDQGQAERTIADMAVRRWWDLYTQRGVDVRSAARLLGHRLLATRQRAVYNRDVLVPVQVAATHHAQLHYNAMFIGVFDLLNSKRSEIDAGRRYVTAHRDYWLARADLEQLLMGRMVQGAMSAPANGAGGAMAAGGGGGH
ncbi:TolC family protein [bacterium]|nr:TolC family protein [bacterium]